MSRNYKVLGYSFLFSQAFGAFLAYSGGIQWGDSGFPLILGGMFILWIGISVGWFGFDA